MTVVRSESGWQEEPSPEPLPGEGFGRVASRGCWTPAWVLGVAATLTPALSLKGEGERGDSGGCEVWTWGLVRGLARRRRRGGRGRRVGRRVLR